MTRTDQAVAVGVGGLVLFFLMRPRVTDGGLGTSLYGVFPPEIQRAAEAIARAEGFYQAGSIPQRAHNPGDLKLGGTTINGITVFDDDDQGWHALYKQLALIVTGQSARYRLDMTVAQMARVWTATEQSAWANNVAAALGVTLDTPLSEVLV